MIDHNDWDEYFAGDSRGFFKRLLMLHRRVFIAPGARRHFDRVFPRDGVFVEAGAGTSESSQKIGTQGRTVLAMDLSYLVLQRFNVLPLKMQGDIRMMPIGDGEVSGIWNFGVLEHFTDDQLIIILSEFRRVLADDGRLLLFWPPWYALHELVLGTVSWLARHFLRKEVVFFPDEVNLYTTRRRAAELFDRAGLHIERTSFGPRDLFSYVVVVASRKPSICPPPRESQPTADGTVA